MVTWLKRLPFSVKQWLLVAFFSLLECAGFHLDLSIWIFSVYAPRFGLFEGVVSFWLFQILMSAEDWLSKESDCSVNWPENKFPKTLPFHRSSATHTTVWDRQIMLNWCHDMSNSIVTDLLCVFWWLNEGSAGFLLLAADLSYTAPVWLSSRTAESPALLSARPETGHPRGVSTHIQTVHKYSS